jgi:hypothetical protein
LGEKSTIMKTYYKYPRTPHLPWSPGATDDDIRVLNTAHLAGKNVVVTIKRDGESTSVYWDGKVHARSIDSSNHPSRDWIKRLAASISHEFPVGWRVVFENLYAEHTIHYKELKSYAEVISIWDGTNVCLSWADTKEWCALFNLYHVPVLYEGIYDEKLIKGLYQPFDEFGDPMEGYVVRVVDAFHRDDFNTSVAKYVSAQFKDALSESGDDHWLEKHKCGISTNELTLRDAQCDLQST